MFAGTLEAVAFYSYLGKITARLEEIFSSRLCAVLAVTQNLPRLSGSDPASAVK